MASDCIQKWISAKMITTDRDRKLKVGKAIKNDRQNILCYLSTPACTCTINCLHAWPPDSNSMVYKQYLLWELKLRHVCWIHLELQWQVVSNNMLVKYRGPILRVTFPALGSADLSLDQSAMSIQFLLWSRDSFLIELKLYNERLFWNIFWVVCFL